MEKLLKQHYESIKKRGQIDDSTIFDDFITKLEEEIQELKNASFEGFNQEAIECFCVISNMMQHFDIDIKEELKINLIHQQTRND